MALGIESAGKTDIGRERAVNEDAWAIDEKGGFLIVADGLGGHNSGEVASALAIETLLRRRRRPAPKGASGGRRLGLMIRKANTAIRAAARRDPKSANMATTVVAVLVQDSALIVGHVGDSRLYLLRGGRLRQLTQDHSVVADQLSRGMITAEEARNSSFQNILTRAVGTEPRVEADIGEHPLAAGDALLLCTDGLYKMVPDPEIEKALAGEDAPLALCDRLVGMALAAGGEDNVTVVVARLCEKRGMLETLRSFFRRKGPSGSSE